MTRHVDGSIRPRVSPHVLVFPQVAYRRLRGRRPPDGSEINRNLVRVITVVEESNGNCPIRHVPRPNVHVLSTVHGPPLRSHVLVHGDHLSVVQDLLLQIADPGEALDCSPAVADVPAISVHVTCDVIPVAREFSPAPLVRPHGPVGVASVGCSVGARGDGVLLLESDPALPTGSRRHICRTVRDLGGHDKGARADGPHGELSLVLRSGHVRSLSVSVRHLSIVTRLDHIQVIPAVWAPRSVGRDLRRGVDVGGCGAPRGRMVASGAPALHPVTGPLPGGIEAPLARVEQDGFACGIQALGQDGVLHPGIEPSRVAPAKNKHDAEQANNHARFHDAK